MRSDDNCDVKEIQLPELGRFERRPFVGKLVACVGKIASAHLTKMNQSDGFSQNKWPSLETEFSLYFLVVVSLSNSTCLLT